MASDIRIDQVGLPAGVAGRSRTDGLSTGAVVTLTNAAGGATTFRLLWVPLGDTTAVASLAPTGPGSATWTFAPTASRFGTYLIELVRNEGASNETRERRVLRIRTATRGLIIPALNELGDPRASLLNAGAAVVQASDDNATDYSDPALNALDYAGWWRALHELIMAADTGGGGTSYVRQAVELDVPQDNVDWDVDAPIILTADNFNESLVVARFADGTEDACGFELFIPADMTTMTVTLVHNKFSGGGVGARVQPRIYGRSYNPIVGAWGTPIDFNDGGGGIGVSSDSNWATYSQVFPLASFSPAGQVTANAMAQFKLTRNSASGNDTLNGIDWKLKALMVSLA